MEEELTRLLKKFRPQFDHHGNLRRLDTPSARAKNVLMGPNYALVECAGPDAAQFLNRLTTITPSQIEIGRHRLGFLLSAQGKIRFGFECSRERMDGFHLYCASEDKDALIESLDMFHFGEDLTLRALGDRVSLLRKNEAAGPDHAAFGSAQLTQWRGHKDLTLDLVPTAAFLNSLKEHSDFAEALDGQDAFDRLRAKYRIAMSAHELLENFTPLDVGCMGGIVQQKGCYPGQEVIERTIALGRPARKLVSVSMRQFRNSQQIKDSVHRDVGQITTLVRSFSGKGAEGLAVVKYTLPLSETYYVDGESIILTDDGA